VRGYHCPPVQQPYANSLPLDGSVPEDDILELADLAYEAVVAKLPKYRQRELTRSVN
jgi:predicted DNA-binding protein (MmcQ/YjbR family)